MKTLPPDAPLLSLARIVNARLGLGAAVNFYLIENDEHSMETGIVYQCGLRRAVVKTRAMLSDGDADEIVRAVSDWSQSIAPNSKWTTDPREAA